MALNRRRLALSLGLLGAVVVPLWTGSAQRLVRHPSSTAIELIKDNRTPWLEAHGVDKYSCAIDEVMKDTVSDLCRQSMSIENEIVERPSYPNVPPVVRDAAIGFLAPVLGILVGPWLVAGYVRWVTR